MNKRNILLCVAGMTPQIITETLFAVTQKDGGRIDEIRVITTLEGRNKVLQSLLNKESGKFYEFCRDFGIEAGAIKFDETTIALLDTPDGRTLEDIRTPEENALAGDKICEIVRELCRDETVNIHASAAGGRKTMSIYLTAAMQLFGRADDTLSHVLVNENFEGNPNFFYPTPTPKTLTLRDGREVSTADAQIYLAEVPFIRLRGIGAKAFDERAKTYRQAVGKAQADLKLAETAYDLRLDFKRLTVKVADRAVKISLREFFVYALFAYYRKNGFGENGFTGLHKISREHLDKICRLISKAKGAEKGFEDFELLPKAEFIYSLDVESLRDKSEDDGERISVAVAREKIVDTLRQVLGKITPKMAKSFMPEEFDIERRGEKEAFIFGLKIEPERIKFE